MNKTVIAFFAGIGLVIAVSVVWIAMDSYQRAQEEKRVMDFLTAPTPKGFEPVLKEETE